MEEQDEFGTPRRTPGPRRTPERQAGESEVDARICGLEEDLKDANERVARQRSTIAILWEDGSSSKKAPTQETVTKNNKTQNVESKLADVVKSSSDIVTLVSGLHGTIQRFQLGNSFLALSECVTASEYNDEHDIVFGHDGINLCLLGSDLKSQQKKITGFALGRVQMRMSVSDTSSAVGDLKKGNLANFLEPYMTEEERLLKPDVLFDILVHQSGVICDTLLQLNLDRHSALKSALSRYEYHILALPLVLAHLNKCLPLITQVSLTEKTNLRYHVRGEALSRSL